MSRIVMPSLRRECAPRPADSLLIRPSVQACAGAEVPGRKVLLVPGRCLTSQPLWMRAWAPVSLPLMSRAACRRTWLESLINLTPKSLESGPMQSAEEGVTLENE